MTYEDLGFSKLLYKASSATKNLEMSGDQSELAVSSLSGSVIAGGITKSTTGKILINWDLGQILIGDGANWRVLIGDDGL